MKALLVFIPNTLQDKLPGYLIGHYREDSAGRYIYIIGIDICDELSNNVIGTYSTKLKKVHKNLRNEPPIWISITCFKKEISVDYFLVNKIVQNLKDCLLIVYDINNLLKSELLLIPHERRTKEINHFKILASDLQALKGSQVGYGFNFLSRIIDVTMLAFSVVNFILHKSYLVTKYSTLVLRLRNYYGTVLWVRNTYKEIRFINLKVGNCLVSILTDVLLGFLLFYIITTRWKSADQIFDSILLCTENVIFSISRIVNWLMGSPAGLKLNQPLSSFFGSLVLYYLEIWWSFLSMVRPVLEIFFQIFIKIGFLGLTFQLAVCADIFAIISFHVYCIYVYAARLYEIQAKGLYSLSRLFLGRKRNPEPGKVDSCPYSTVELLIGTISFAVLLFLLPTTLVYYVVFTVMRLGVLIISGFMTRTVYFLQTLPVYVTFLWLFFPAYTATTVKLTPHDKLSDFNQGCLIAKPASSSWIDTVKLCNLDLVSPPVPVKFGETVWKIIVGKLL